MKRMICLLIAVCTLFGITACGSQESQENESETTETVQTEPVVTAPRLDYTVANPTPTPDYTVPENYTTDDLRQIAIRAMRDILTVEWTPARYYTYKNRYDWVNKQFQYVTGVTFNGIPYANAHTGIFQWYKFYDPETGIMDYPGSGQQWGEALGTVCADAVLWGWSTVCNSYDSITYTYHMTPGNNFVGTGYYELPSDITSYKLQTTDMICEMNGLEVMAYAYSKMLPADALTSTSDGHAVMAIREPEVVYLEDGSIDVDNSFIIYQDQSGGTSNHFTEVEQDGVIHYYVGNTEKKLSFANAFKRGFIPITTKEFLGQKPYSAAEAAYQGATNSLSDLYTASIATNYPLCSAELLAEDAQGQRTRIAIELYTKADGGNKTGEEGYTYYFEDLLTAEPNKALQNLTDTVKVVLLAQVSTGDEFEIATFPVE